MTSLNDLIQSVEQGEGADREIDASVWYALIEKPPHVAVVDRDMVGKWPEYSSSLDAVVSLIKERLPGHGYCFATGWDDDGNVGGFVSPEKTVDLSKAVMGQAKEPSRALLSAFLRAYHAQKEMG